MPGAAGEWSPALKVRPRITIACATPAMNSMAVSRSRNGAPPSPEPLRPRSEIRSCGAAVLTPRGSRRARPKRARGRRVPEALVDRLQQERCRIDAELRVQLAHARGAGDVDLGDEATDHV